MIRRRAQLPPRGRRAPPDRFVLHPAFAEALQLTPPPFGTGTSNAAFVGVSYGPLRELGREGGDVFPRCPCFQNLEFFLKPATAHLKGQLPRKCNSALMRKDWFVLTMQSLKLPLGEDIRALCPYKDKNRDCIFQQTSAIKFWKLILFSISYRKTNFWDKLLHWNFILRFLIFMNVILACIYTLY